jgi:hypothetical protein
MNRKITGKSVVKFVGWITVFATILMILMKVFSNIQTPITYILLGFSSSTFCLYLGYSR